MRVIFAGTPELAATVLGGLLDAPGHEVVGVLTRADKPVGRHRSAAATSPVKKLAIESGLPLLQPESLRDPHVADWLEALAADAVAVAAYGKIIPAALLAAPARGFINVHASLLPRWRGAAPIQRAILAGDAETGVCIMQVDEGLDSGPVWACERVTIGPDETAGELTARLASLGARLLPDTLSAIESGRLSGPVQQDAAGATAAPKLTPAEVVIDWSVGAAELHRRIKAANPSPGARLDTAFGVLKIWRTAPGALTPEAPGTVTAIEPVLVVAASDRELSLLEVQPAGKGRMSGAEFARGRRIRVGDRLVGERVGEAGWDPAGRS